jgi:hypothetical protein
MVAMEITDVKQEPTVHTMYVSTLSVDAAVEDTNDPHPVSIVKVKREVGDLDSGYVQNEATVDADCFPNLSDENKVDTRTPCRVLSITVQH